MYFKYSLILVNVVLFNHQNPLIFNHLFDNSFDYFPKISLLIFCLDSILLYFNTNHIIN